MVRARIFISRALSSALPHVSGAPVITGPLVKTTMTDDNGQFVAAYLPDGSYVVCAQAAAPGLLDPCHWAASAPRFTITAGKAVTGVQVAMAKGAVVAIHVDDPQQLLAPAKGAAESDLRVYLVTAQGHHYEAFIVAHEAKSRDHAITVPFGSPITLSVFGPHLTVNDESGKAVSAAKSVSIPAAANPPTVTYRVSGTRP